MQKQWTREKKKRNPYNGNLFIWNYANDFYINYGFLLLEYISYSICTMVHVCIHLRMKTAAAAAAAVSISAANIMLNAIHIYCY